VYLHLNIVSTLGSDIDLISWTFKYGPGISDVVTGAVASPGLNSTITAPFQGVDLSTSLNNYIATLSPGIVSQILAFYAAPGGTEECIAVGISLAIAYLNLLLDPTVMNMFSYLAVFPFPYVIPFTSLSSNLLNYMKYLFMLFASSVAIDAMPYWSYQMVEFTNLFTDLFVAGAPLDNTQAIYYAEVVFSQYVKVVWALIQQKEIGLLSLIDQFNQTVAQSLILIKNATSDGVTEIQSATALGITQILSAAEGVKDQVLDELRCEIPDVLKEFLEKQLCEIKEKLNHKIKETDKEIKDLACQVKTLSEMVKRLQGRS
jgi:hypothetical protein